MPEIEEKILPSRYFFSIDGVLLAWGKARFNYLLTNL